MGVGRFDRLIEVSVCCEYVAHHVDRLDSERPKALMITDIAMAYVVECDKQNACDILLMDKALPIHLFRLVV